MAQIFRLFGKNLAWILWMLRFACNLYLCHASRIEHVPLVAKSRAAQTVFH